MLIIYWGEIVFFRGVVVQNYSEFEKIRIALNRIEKRVFANKEVLLSNVAPGPQVFEIKGIKNTMEYTFIKVIEIKANTLQTIGLSIPLK